MFQVAVVEHTKTHYEAISGYSDSNRGAKKISGESTKCSKDPE